jgi:hypothetical protein
MPSMFSTDDFNASCVFRRATTIMSASMFWQALNAALNFADASR